jgi:hypothetical protein
MASTAGRLIRFVVGVLLIVVGLIEGGGWFVLAVVGLVPLFAAAFNICLFAPMFSQPFHGRDVRA